MTRVLSNRYVVNGPFTLIGIVYLIVATVLFMISWYLKFIVYTNNEKYTILDIPVSLNQQIELDQCNTLVEYMNTLIVFCLVSSSLSLFKLPLDVFMSISVILIGCGIWIHGFIVDDVLFMVSAFAFVCMWLFRMSLVVCWSFDQRNVNQFKMLFDPMHHLFLQSIFIATGVLITGVFIYSVVFFIIDCGDGKECFTLIVELVFIEIFILVFGASVGIYLIINICFGVKTSICTEVTAFTWLCFLVCYLTSYYWTLDERYVGDGSILHEKIYHPRMYYMFTLVSFLCSVFSILRKLGMCDCVERVVYDLESKICES